MRFRKMTALFLSAAMCFGLSACNREKVPAPEDLLAGNNVQQAESIDADLTMQMEVKIPTSDLFGDIDDAMDMDSTMKMSLGADLNIKGSKSVQKTEGTIEVEMLGTSFSQEMLSYMSTDENGTTTTYSKAFDYDMWTYTVSEAGEGVDLSSVAGMDASLIDNLSMKPVEREDTAYVVTGEIDLAQLEKKTGMDMGQMLENSGLADNLISEGKLDAELTFDRENQQLTDLTMSLDPDSVDSTGTEITELTISLHINSLNDAEVEIPKDVIANAIETFEYADFGDEYVYEDYEFDDIYPEFDWEPIDGVPCDGDRIEGGWDGDMSHDCLDSDPGEIAIQPLIPAPLPKVY